jgi:AcrR family transcriptional regulator
MSTVDRGRKGERTRQRIVEQAAVLFNTRGVAGASMADVSEATGLEKGGVYNHFATKEQLAIAAFEHGAGLVRAYVDGALATEGTALGKLRAFLGWFRERSRPMMPGGCPLMNTAIEADDTNPELKRRVRAALEYWRTAIATTIEAGIASGEFRPIDARAAGSVMLALIEGAQMLSNLHGDRSHMIAAIDHLDAFIESIRV